MSQPGNVITFTTTTEGAEEFASILQRAVAHAQAEAGATTWIAVRDEADPTLFYLADLFTDAAARDAHFQGEAAALILGEGGPLFAKDPQVAAVTLIGAKGA